MIHHQKLYDESNSSVLTVWGSHINSKRHLSIVDFQCWRIKNEKLNLPTQTKTAHCSTLLPPKNAGWYKNSSFNLSYYYLISWSIGHGLVHVFTISDPAMVLVDVDHARVKRALSKHVLTWRPFHICHKHGRRQWCGLLQCVSPHEPFDLHYHRHCKRPTFSPFDQLYQWCLSLSQFDHSVVLLPHWQWSC